MGGQDKQANGVGQTLAWALANGAPGQILRYIGENAPVGTGQIANDLDLKKTYVRRVVRRLCEGGAIEQTGSRQRRGAAERLYGPSEASWLTSEDWSALPPKLRRQSMLGSIRPVVQWLADLVSSPGPGALPDYVLISTRRRVDEQGWSELAEIHRRASFDAEQVAARSAARLRGCEEGALVASSIFFLFDAPSGRNLK